MAKKIDGNYDILKEREYEHCVIKIGRSNVALHQWLVKRNDKYGDVRMGSRTYTNEIEAWRQFHSWCIGAEETEAERWFGIDKELRT